MKCHGLALMLLSLACPLWPQAEDLSHTWTSPCKLDVVLVRFADGTPTAGDTTYRHNDHDIPHGGTLRIIPATASSPQTDEWVPGTTSYTLDDFKRLFGVSGTSFSGTDLTVANGGEDLPHVFGSVADYYNEVSGGDYRLEVRIVNRAMTGENRDYPDWIRLPHTRWDYARGMYNFWDHAYVAAVAAGYTDLPDGSTIASRKSHKVAYVYGGPEIADNSRLHPRADRTTTSSSTSGRVESYGYQYVAAERKGSGRPDNQTLDRSSGINVHAHEIGHFLGLPDWDAPAFQEFTVANPYTEQTVGGERSGADWNLMQSAAHGPGVWADPDGATGTISRTVIPYGSSPMAPSVVYRKRLGWNMGGEVITATVEDKIIDPGPAEYYRIVTKDHPSDASEIILDLRAAEGFGEFVSWHRFDELVGILMWKELRTRGFGGAVSWDPPRLIPADGRWMRDSRRRDSSGDPIDRQMIDASLTPGRSQPNLQSGDDAPVYQWQDQVSDPFLRAPVEPSPASEPRHLLASRGTASAEPRTPLPSRR